jgi:hypothetical protein
VHLKIMQRLRQQLVGLLVILLIGLGVENTSAQDRPPDLANLDPQQLQEQIKQRIIEAVHEQLVMTNDADWNAIEPLVAKVVQDQTESLMPIIIELRGLFGNSNAGADPDPSALDQIDPDAEALQNCLDANAPTEQIRAALAKYHQSRKRKEAELAKDRELLRSVLSTRQEAVLVLMGILN